MGEAHMRRHMENAVKLFHQGKYRESANEYWLSFCESPALTHTSRWQIFHGYTSILKEEYFPSSDQDFENMRKVLDDKFEIRLFRVEAGLVLGLMLYTRGERHKCADVYYKAVTIGEKKLKTKGEKMEQRKMSFNSNSIADMKSIKYLMDQVLDDVRGNLNGLTGNRPKAVDPSAFQPTLRSNGTFMAPKMQNQMMGIGPGGTSLTGDQFEKLLNIGGVSCDCCNKKDVKLRTCQRCKKSFYCSIDCQQKQWKENGHKKFCREEGEYKAGDLVQLNRLKSKPILNHAIVRIVGPAPTAGRWEVRIEGGDKSISVSTNNMNHLRPFDCVV